MVLKTLQRKERNKNRRRILWCSAVAVLAVAAVSVTALLLTRDGGGGGEPGKGTDDVKDGYYLLTIDGYGVTEDEFRLFLNDERALTAGYFYQRYGAQPDAGFWHRDYDGQTPMEYAKESALNKLLSAKMEFIIAGERGVREYAGFDAMIYQMQAANAERERKSEAGGVIYGLSSYDAFTYFNYIRSIFWSELKKSQEELTHPTDKQLEALYNENKGMFDRGVEFTYEVRYTDGDAEAVTVTMGEVGKEDYETMELLELLADMDEGESTGERYYRGKTADITLISKDQLGYDNFSDARDYLKRIYAEQELREFIADRVGKAIVEMDQERFNAIEFYMGG